MLHISSPIAAQSSGLLLTAAPAVHRHAPRVMSALEDPELDELLPFDEIEDEVPEASSAFNLEDMPGVTEPLGFFDPAGFSEGASEGKIKFYREVELKHGRIAMLAALGFPLAEQFHPLFGGEVDVASYVAFQETPLLA